MKRLSHALFVVTFVGLVTALLACSPAQPPKPASETGGPAPTASTSAKVHFLSNQ
jgi:hypothetical protein